jgi:amino-acid N-acetyltransferase
VLTQLTYVRSEERGARSEERDDVAARAGGFIPHSALRIPHSGGVATAVLTVRPARIADMREVEPLINRFAAQNLMLSKSGDQLVRTFREFVVAVDDTERVIGCGALRVYSDTLAEIVSLAVHPSAHGTGVGRALVERLIQEARDLEIRTLFALTLQDVFFHRLGFHTVPKEMFPLKVWADCRNCPKLHACDEIAVAMEISVEL